MNEKWDFISQINHILWYFTGFIPLFIFIILLSFSTQLSNDQVFDFTITSFIVINLIFLIVAIIYGMIIYYDLHNFIKEDICRLSQLEMPTIVKFYSKNDDYTKNLIELILPIVFFPISNIFGQIMYFFFLFLLLFLRLHTDNPYVNLLVAFKYNTYIGKTKSGKKILIITDDIIEPKEGGFNVYRINVIPNLFVYDKGLKKKDIIFHSRNYFLILLKILSIVLLLTIVIAWVTYADLPYEFWNLTIGKLGGRWIWNGEIQGITNSTSQMIFTIGICLCGGICLALFIMAFKFKNKIPLDFYFFLVLSIGAFLYSLPRDNPNLSILHYGGAVLFIDGLGVYSAITQIYRHGSRKKEFKWPKLNMVILWIIISINILYTIGLIASNIIGIDSEFIYIFNALAQKLVVLISIISIWRLGKDDVGVYGVSDGHKKITPSDKNPLDRRSQRITNILLTFFLMMVIGSTIRAFLTTSI